MQNNFSYFWISNIHTRHIHENLTVLEQNRFLKMTSRNSHGRLSHHISKKCASPPPPAPKEWRLSAPLIKIDELPLLCR